MTEAFSGIYTLFRNFIAFYMNAEIIENSGVTLFGLFIVGFVFTILLKFVLAVPKTYKGERDEVYTSSMWRTNGEVGFTDSFTWRKGRWK